ncbi:hypothetical protein DERF_013994 [Dermatophagoides farinae]|uniref:Uncharacterized protein n=1 Tax=Dermatophagoides farinae TaxID=6954 RepID=A0A922HNG9_DERFA|nr:hypothetical protein DERF_013994 [Dermatophagoides farinae]
MHNIIHSATTTVPLSMAVLFRSDKRLYHYDDCRLATLDPGTDIESTTVVVDDDSTTVQCRLRVFPSCLHIAFSDSLFRPMVCPKDRMECPDPL